MSWMLSELPGAGVKIWLMCMRHSLESVSGEKSGSPSSGYTKGDEQSKWSLYPQNAGRMVSSVRQDSDTSPFLHHSRKWITPEAYLPLAYALSRCHCSEDCGEAGPDVISYRMDHIHQ